MIGIGLAASGHWPYAVRYVGAIANANFNFSILMRNEIFGRLLYLFVNTLFAKVNCIDISNVPILIVHDSGHLFGGVSAARRFFSTWEVYILVVPSLVLPGSS
jgi:hypothetical protein